MARINVVSLDLSQIGVSVISVLLNSRTGLYLRWRRYSWMGLNK